jgi:hypothetical protein
MFFNLPTLTATAILLSSAVISSSYNTSVPIVHLRKGGKEEQKCENPKDLNGSGRGHETVGTEKVEDELIETRRVFDTAGMTGAGQNLVNRSWD